MSGKGKVTEYDDKDLLSDEKLNFGAPILFKDYKWGSLTLNKSYLVKLEDIQAASLTRKPNSISFIEAILKRAEAHKVIKVGKKVISLRDFAKQEGLELFLDLAEVVAIRVPVIVEGKVVTGSLLNKFGGGKDQ